MFNLRLKLIQLIREWQSALRDKTFAWKLFLTPGLFFIYSAVTQKLGNYVEMRKGIQLEDNLLNFFPSYDFSAPVFILLYSSLALVVITHIHRPKVILRIIEMHFLVAVVRQICILGIALDPPTGIIVLRDLFLENTVYPRHSPLTKDLFFSGHAATMFLFYFFMNNKVLKYTFLVAAIAVSVGVVVQHVHYSYDVIAAPIFAYIAYRLITKFSKHYQTEASVV